MKVKVFTLCLALLLAAPFASAEILYTSTDFSDWTLNGMQVISGNSIRATAGPQAAYVTTGNEAWKNSIATVKVDVNWAGGMNPMILSRVTDSNSFYMYRITRTGQTTASTELYEFNNGTNTQLLSGSLTTDPSKTAFYYRLTTLDVGDKTWLVGETSYDADFSTILTRLKKSAANQLSGTSVGVRSYSDAQNSTYSNYTVSSLNAWTNAAGGNWTDAANWSGGTVPNAAGETADFSLVDPNSTAAVTVSGTQTVGRLIFGDTSGSTAWTVSGGAIQMSSGVEGAKSVITVEKDSKVTLS
ncbi:MAG: hypothetical protein IJK97_07370, partial [Thermoguttaceae bacterium]|nr:hypothetical protein [Thermoguttaceae bacterium]